MLQELFISVFLLFVDLSQQTPLAGNEFPFVKERDAVKTTTSLPATTTSASAALKSGIPDCGIRGTATYALLAQILDSTHASNVLACQSSCEGRSRCESWSWYPPAVSTTSSSSSSSPSEDNPGTEANCVYYTTYITNAETYIDVDSQSETVFSDKYPEDGSNFCYGDPLWGWNGISITRDGGAGTVGDSLSAPTGEPQR